MIRMMIYRSSDPLILALAAPQPTIQSTIRAWIPCNSHLNFCHFNLLEMIYIVLTFLNDLCMLVFVFKFVVSSMECNK